jgi:hypothetical protein
MKKRHPDVLLELEREKNNNIVDNNDKNNNDVVCGSDDNDIDDDDDDDDGNKNKNKNREMKKKKLYDITISIVGNSMGGLYGRYSIAKLVERYCVEEKEEEQEQEQQKQEKDNKIHLPCCWILDGKYRLHFNIFCTTASPHLGVSQHTWIRIPRILEIIIAYIFMGGGQSGIDLFWINNNINNSNNNNNDNDNDNDNDDDLLYKIATNSTYLNPLKSFQQRIAYANCYRTDFPVPMKTAAFFSEKSTYPHYFILDDDGSEEDEQQQQQQQQQQYGSMIIASLRTPIYGNDKEIDSYYDDTEYDDHDDDKLYQMSVSLDKLGWKKVLVDVREQLPSIRIRIKIPQWWGQQQRRRRVLSEESENDLVLVDDNNNSTTTTTTTTSNNLHDLKKQQIVTSKDIVNAIQRVIDPSCDEGEDDCDNDNDNDNDNNNNDFRFHLPFGHDMIVAFSRNRLRTFFNKGGRPIVDKLAKELVDDIFDWNTNINNNEKNITRGGMNNNIMEKLH